EMAERPGRPFPVVQVAPDGRRSFEQLRRAPEVTDHARETAIRGQERGAHDGRRRGPPRLMNLLDPATALTQISPAEPENPQGRPTPDPQSRIRASTR